MIRVYPAVIAPRTTPAETAKIINRRVAVEVLISFFMMNKIYLTSF